MRVVGGTSRQFSGRKLHYVMHAAGDADPQRQGPLECNIENCIHARNVRSISSLPGILREKGNEGPARWSPFEVC